MSDKKDENIGSDGKIERIYKLEEKKYDDEGNEILPDERIPADFLRRASAFFIDTSILTIPYLFLNLSLFVLFGITTHSLLATIIEIAFNKFGLFESQTALALTVFASVITWIVIVQIFGVFYYSFFEIKYSASLGKKLLSIKVVDIDGFKPKEHQIIERNMLKLISLVCFGAGFLMPLFSLRNQALHDAISKIIVVKVDGIKQEQLIASHCLGFGLAIALYLIFSNEQTTLEQLKPILPSTKMSDAVSINLDLSLSAKNTPEISTKKSLKVLKKATSLTKNVKVKQDADINDVVSELSDNQQGDSTSTKNLTLKKGRQGFEEFSEVANEASSNSSSYSEPINSETKEKKKESFSFSLSDLKKLKNKPKFKVGVLKAIGRQWGINAVYARVKDLNQNSRTWRLNLYFFPNQFNSKDYLILNRTKDPFKENVLPANPALFFYSVEFNNKSIVCSRSDSLSGFVMLSPLIQNEIKEKAGFFPDSILEIHPTTLHKESFFKAPCITTFKQSDINSKLKGDASLSREYFKEIEWNISLSSKLYEYSISERIFYDGTENNFSIWNPKLNLLTIANLNSALEKDEIKKIYFNQSFIDHIDKVEALIQIEVDKRVNNLSNDQIKNGYKVTLFPTKRNKLPTKVVIKRYQNQTPKMLAGSLKQGGKLIGRFEGIEEMQIGSELAKIKWSIPVDSRVLVIK